MGTDAWENWNAFRAGETELENVDDEMFSDRHFTGEPTTIGPYTLTPVHGHGAPTTAATRHALSLHVGLHANLVREVVVNGELAADSAAYHGGNASDEVAALVSLVLGIRLRVAGTSRLSGIHAHDEAQTPIQFEVIPLAHPGRPGREYVPATQTRPANLDHLTRLESFPNFDEHTQIELIRAARSYASALWWSNEDQNLAWLQLVTAIEIAATRRQVTNGTPEELIEELWPELWDVVVRADDDVRSAVCKQVAPQARATRKFVDFLTVHHPPAPEPRPTFDGLERAEMPAHAKLIYRHRSTSLHTGKPFPLPMLEQPRVEENGAIQEVPWGLNTGGLGGIWDASEAPMLLSTFEYITRGSLLSWWDELIADDAASPAPATPG